MPYSINDLRTLELQPQDLDNLTEEEQKKILRDKWRVLCLRYHPDKSIGFRDQYEAVIEAYNRLTSSEQNHYQHDIMCYFTPTDVPIPIEGFDLTQQEGINMAYDALLTQFSNLRSESVKKKFVQYYEPFLNLAISLEKQHDALNHKRSDHFYEQSQESYKQKYTREWRLLVLRIFAEEYLDDFLYREALGMGNIWPILATRKLLNPLKWITCALNTAILFGLYGGQYLLEIVIKDWFLEFLTVYNDTNRSWYSIAQITLNLLAFSALSLLPFYIMPSIAFYLMSLPLVWRFLEITASPNSKYIRPCSKLLGHSEKNLSIASMTALGLIAVFSFFNMSMVLASLPFILSGLNILTSLYMLYSVVKLIKLTYQIQPALAVFQIILLVAPIFLQFIFPLPESLGAPTLANLFGRLLSTLSSCTILEIANSKLQDMSAYQGELMEILPLPKEPIRSELKTACLLGYKKAIWSHRLFNTSKDATSLSIEEARATSSTWACLWGRARPAERNPEFSENRLLLTH